MNQRNDNDFSAQGKRQRHRSNAHGHRDPICRHFGDRTTNPHHLIGGTSHQPLSFLCRSFVWTK